MTTPRTEAGEDEVTSLPFVVRQFEGHPWVPLREAVRLHEAHQEAMLRNAALQNGAAPLDGLRDLLISAGDWLNHGDIDAADHDIIAALDLLTPGFSGAALREGETP